MLVVVLAVLGVVAAAPITPMWAMQGHDAQHTGRSPVQGPQGSSVR